MSLLLSRIIPFFYTFASRIKIMRIIKIWNDDPSATQIAQTAATILDGQVIIWKTDTRYAFACNALDKKAVERICALKRINPEKSRLSIACSSISMAAEYVKIDNRMFRLLKATTPGPFTFIFRTGNTLPKAFRGRKEAGIRFPDSGTCRRILERVQVPMLTASLPDDDPDYAVEPGLIADRYEGTVDLLLDCGDGTLEETTVVNCTGSEPEIIRQGEGEIDI